MHSPKRHPLGRLRLSAAAGAGLYLLSFSAIKAASLLCPHPIFVLSYFASLFSFAKMTISRDTRWRYPAAIAAGLAFCSLEVSLALFGAFVVCCFHLRRDLFAGWPASRWIRFAMGPAAAFAGTVALVWPGALWKLSFLKAYFFLAYLAVARKNAWGSSISVRETWVLRFLHSPVEWLLVAAALFLFFRSIRSQNPARLMVRPVAVPLLVYAGFMFLLVVRVNTEEPRYLDPLLPALLVFAGLVLASEISSWRMEARAAILAGAGLAVFWASYHQFLANPIAPTPLESRIVACLKDQDLTGKTILVPSAWIPTIHYYFPDVGLKGYAGAAPPAGDRVDGVLIAGDQVWFRPFPHPLP